MSNYIDGFVLPIPRDRVTEYQRVAEKVAEIYKEHGAIDYVEYVGDDMHREGTRSFNDLARSTERDSVVFGWITFDSREQRDLVNKKVETDPRMPDLIAPLIDPANPIFDPKQMAYGGFRTLVGAQDETGG